MTAGQGGSAAEGTRWSPQWRLLASLLLILHLMAVAVPPLAFQTTGPLGLSPSVATALRLVESYCQMLYLDRGYAFFAPDPGPSHLIQVGLSDRSGKLTERVYPDRRQQWPRLLYHRHFMLSEYLNDIHQPPGPPEELIKLDPETAAIWSDARARYEQVRGSMSNHLERAHPGTTAQIRRIEHLIPDVIEFREQQIALTDRRLYQVLLDQPLATPNDSALQAPDRRSEMGAESVPAPGGTSPAAQPDSDPRQPELDRTEERTATEPEAATPEGDSGS